MKKRILILCLGLMMILSSCSSGTNSRMVGEWRIADLNIEPQAMWSYYHNDTVKQLEGAFPEINSFVEFTNVKYDDGYKLISSSNVVSYSIMSDSRISVGDAVGTYKIDGNSLIIEFKDTATVTLKKN